MVGIFNRAAELQRPDSGVERRLTGRQITIIVVAICAAVVAAPTAALAVTGTFSSNSASTPAVSAKNTSSGTGAKAVFGNASATSGTVYGLYGRTGSSAGYGVYSAGRLGASGPLVCSQCVSAGDVNAAGFPTVPSATNAKRLGGHSPSYYARIVPLGWDFFPAAGFSDVTTQLASVGGLVLSGECITQDHFAETDLHAVADSSADQGPLNWFTIDGSSSSTAGQFLQTTPATIGQTTADLIQGRAIFHNSATKQVVTVDYFVWRGGGECQVFGDVLTTG